MYWMVLDGWGWVLGPGLGGAKIGHDITAVRILSRLLLSVSDTLRWRGGGGVRVGGSKAFFNGFWEAWTPPWGGWVGFSWVLGVRTLGLRGIANFNIVLTQ